MTVGELTTKGRVLEPPIPSITSLEFYLSYSPEDAVETLSLEDVGAAIYPCYYVTVGDRLRVSSSAVSLIRSLGSFQRDRGFKNPDFLYELFKDKDLAFKIKRKLNRHFGFPKLKGEIDSWYVTWNTIDQRVKKLKAFEKVTARGATQHFKPDYSLHDNDLIASKSADCITRFIQGIEKRYPEHDHIVMTAGKDSQLIWLAPRLNAQKWHAFSAEPNYPLVLEWFEKNAIKPNKVYKHDNHNEETPEEFRKKIICGDLYSDPTHIRWMPAMVRIASEFKGKCFFWGGTMSSPAHVYGGPYAFDYSADKSAFFKSHFERTALWQGNYHQVFKNYTGIPYLSPFHSQEIWEEVYRHLDPADIKKEVDLREAIGYRLLGRPVWWIKDNPGPAVYSYPAYVNARKTYVDYIRKIISKKEVS